ncbi:hypothetical protein SCALM49S_04810 [Streptomyces californicus]
MPQGALDLEGTAGIWVPSLVQHALSLSPADRRRLRERVRATAGQPRPARSPERPRAAPGPAGFGSLLVYIWWPYRPRVDHTDQGPVPADAGIPAGAFLRPGDYIFVVRLDGTLRAMSNDALDEIDGHSR